MKRVASALLRATLNLWTLSEAALLICICTVSRQDHPFIFGAALGVLMVVTFFDGKYAAWHRGRHQ